MSGRKGNPETLRALGRRLVRVAGVQTAQRAAAQIAPALTAEARASFEARRTPYGDPWLPGHDGSPVDLYETGALKAGLTFVSVGTRVRCVLGARHAKYQVGKRQVLPPSGRPLPPAWRARADELVRQVIAAELEGR